MRMLQIYITAKTQNFVSLQKKIFLMNEIETKTVWNNAFAY